jgi:RNA polymerase sigma factor (sigma-70 family)
VRASADDPLVEVGNVVRRVLAARTADQHLVEDLTQETIVRVAGLETRLASEALRAYAIVTARNLLASHARGESVRRRHAHRLVDYTHLDGPEHLTLEQEETDALAAALEQLGPVERELLLRHEAEGVDLATIASETTTSRGAVAMRLSRARAALRVEFLLAFRKISLPSPHCKPVLLAISAGDRRAQQRLDAAAHLSSCETCAALARPVAGRDRRIAGWLIIPIAEAARRAWKGVRSHPMAATMTGVIAVAVAAAAVMVVRSDGGPETTATPPAPTASATQPSVTTATAITTAAPTVPATAANPCPSPGPLDQRQPTESIGCPFTATRLTVLDVPAEEGFWAAGQQPVWVALVGEGESPIDVEPGQTVTVSGLIAAPVAEATVADGQPGALYSLEVRFDQLSLTD